MPPRPSDRQDAAVDPRGTLDFPETPRRQTGKRGRSGVGFHRPSGFRRCHDPPAAAAIRRESRPESPAATCRFHPVGRVPKTGARSGCGWDGYPDRTGNFAALVSCECLGCAATQPHRDAHRLVVPLGLRLPRWEARPTAGPRSRLRDQTFFSLPVESPKRSSPRRPTLSAMLRKRFVAGWPPCFT